MEAESECKKCRMKVTSDNSVVTDAIGGIAGRCTTGHDFVRIAAAPRSFWIRHWVGQDVSCKQFSAPTNYDAFRKLLMRAFNFPFAAKVYYFPGDNPANIAHRVLVNAEAFQTFLSMPQEDQPLLYMWKRDQTDSPDFGPADQEESKSEVAEDASDTSRGSVQTVWSIGVKNLDGWKCVVCANNHRSTLIGAHVVPRTATPEELRAVRLPTAYEARNGVTMCANCSGLYDTGFFFFEKDGTIHISDALTPTPEWAARAGSKINRTAQRSDENWPTDPIIEARKAYYSERQKRKNFINAKDQNKERNDQLREEQQGSRVHLHTAAAPNKTARNRAFRLGPYKHWRRHLLKRQQALCIV